MFLLVCLCDFLLLSLFSLFQQVWVFCLWSQFCLSLSFHRFVLWSLMRFVMSSFSCFMFGLVGFVLRRLFLVLMRSLIGASSIEFRVFTCPLGMWCLWAVRMRLVESLFEVCTLSGADVFERACSIFS